MLFGMPVMLGRSGISITPSTTSVNEGSSVTWTITGLAPSTTYYYTIAGTATINQDPYPDDYTGYTGSFTSNSSGVGTVTLTAAADVSLIDTGEPSDADETMIFELRTGSVGGTIIATGEAVTINDTSSYTPSRAFSITHVSTTRRTTWTNTPISGLESGDLVIVVASWQGCESNGMSWHQLPTSGWTKLFAHDDYGFVFYRFSSGSSVAVPSAISQPANTESRFVALRGASAVRVASQDTINTNRTFSVETETDNSLLLPCIIEEGYSAQSGIPTSSEALASTGGRTTFFDSVMNTTLATYHARILPNSTPGTGFTSGLLTRRPRSGAGNAGNLNVNTSSTWYGYGVILEVKSA
jgi:hypothetical protein